MRKVSAWFKVVLHFEDDDSETTHVFSTKRFDKQLMSYFMELQQAGIFSVDGTMQTDKLPSDMIDKLISLYDFSIDGATGYQLDDPRDGEKFVPVEHVPLADKLRVVTEAIKSRMPGPAEQKNSSRPFENGGKPTRTARVRGKRSV